MAIDSHRRLRAEADAHVAEVEVLELLVADGDPEDRTRSGRARSPTSRSADLVTFVVPQLERARGLALARLGDLDGCGGRAASEPR